MNKRRVNYRAYLKSAEWTKKREQVIARAGGVCEQCRNNPVHHVHHLTYGNLGNEPLSDLVGLCWRCHNKEHPKRDFSPKAYRKHKRRERSRCVAEAPQEPPHPRPPVQRLHDIRLAGLGNQAAKERLAVDKRGREAHEWAVYRAECAKAKVAKKKDAPKPPPRKKRRCSRWKDAAQAALLRATWDAETRLAARRWSDD